MFYSKWFSKKIEPVKPVSKSEEYLKKITEELFPPLELKKEKDIEYFVDTSIDGNIYAVICDIKEGNSDKVTIKTLTDIHERLTKIRTMLNVVNDMESESNAQYLIVDSVKDK